MHKIQCHHIIQHLILSALFYNYGLLNKGDAVYTKLSGRFRRLTNQLTITIYAMHTVVWWANKHVGHFLNLNIVQCNIIHQN